MTPSNFRDFGGLELTCGRRMVAGRLFRSAAPVEAQAQAVVDHDVTTLIDLRGAEERRKITPFDAAAFGITWLSTPVEPRSSPLIHAALAAGDATPERMRAVMIETYRGFVLDAAPIFGAALVAVLGSERASLIHCTAGKDRTGFLVALIQLAAGVPFAAVKADYLRTNQDWDRASVTGHLPLGLPALEPVMIADIDYLDAALDEVARSDRDVHGFIKRATGGQIGPVQIERLVTTGS